MKLKEAKQILIEIAKRDIKGSGVGIREGVPTGDKLKRIEEAIRIIEESLLSKKDCFDEGCTNRNGNTEIPTLCYKVFCKNRKHSP